MTKVDYIAICDPVSVQEFGHNLAALSRYSKYLFGQCRHLEIFAGSPLSGSEVDKTNFEGNLIYHFSHYYSQPINIPAARLDKTGAQIPSLDSQEAHEVAKKAAIEELRIILDKASQHERALVFFPSIDYYSLLALRHLHEEAKHSRAQILLRFIGVMENFTYHPRKEETLDEVLRFLTQVSIESLKGQYRFSAESPVLADKLSNTYGIDVTVTPTLIDEEKLDPAEDDVFTICFPGSARIDKGFDRIARILDEVDSNYPFLNYRVYLQALPTSELIHHCNVQRKLFKHPRIRVFPPAVSQNELIGYIQKSHIIVLPYCSRIYQERSSAMMAEAACFGRQVVASNRCGFSKHIEDLRIGIICDDEAEMGKAIANYSFLDKATLNSMADDARKNYKELTISSYSKFFGFSS